MAIQRKAKIAALQVAQYVGLSAISRRASDTDIRILAYHGVWTSPVVFSGDAMFIHPEVFARRLDAIVEHGYTVVTLDDAVAALRGEREPISKGVVITIDDGWRKTYEIMAPELHKRGMPATLYCDTRNLLSGQQMVHLVARYARMIVGEDAATSEKARSAYDVATDLDQGYYARHEAAKIFTAEVGVEFDRMIENDTFLYMTPENLGEMADYGVDVQLHTHTHWLGDFSAQRVAQELADNRRVLSELLGRPKDSFRHFCYPSGRYDVEALPHFENGGVRSATTCEMRLATQKDDILLLPRILDNGACSEVEFLSELDGLSPLIRRVAAKSDSRPPQTPLRAPCATPAIPKPAEDQRIVAEEQMLAAAFGARMQP